MDKSTLECIFPNCGFKEVPATDVSRSEHFYQRQHLLDPIPSHQAVMLPLKQLPKWSNNGIIEGGSNA